jgi:hypothetical protein
MQWYAGQTLTVRVAVLIAALILVFVMVFAVQRAVSPSGDHVQTTKSQGTQ